MRFTDDEFGSTDFIDSPQTRQPEPEYDQPDGLISVLVVIVAVAVIGGIFYLMTK